jgi:predicted P-loop ATPase
VVGATTGSEGNRCDVKGIIPDVDRIHLKDRRVIIAYDADAEKNDSVQAARHQFAAALTERGATIGLLEWPIEEGKGLDDRIAKVGAQRVLDDIARTRFGDWRLLLHRSPATGKILPSYDNAAIAIENAPEWAGVLGFDEFTGQICVLRTPPSPISANVGVEITDCFVTESIRWLERHGIMIGPTAAHQVINAVARRNSYHPVRNYLLGLEWDSAPRLDTWLISYCGVASSGADPNEYAMAIGAKFLISAIARVFQPGCKADHMLVLEGEQGMKKSSVARILAGDDWFTDAVREFGSKDCSMQMQGRWIIEVGELGAMKRVEVEHIKAFLSQQVERYRPPYGRFVINQPRQFVLLGTTNSDTYLPDETGNRRFWPIRCGRIDIEGLASDRDQIWAEALFRYNQGERWWLEDASTIEAAIEQQKARYQEDPWQERVVEYAEEEAGLPINNPRGSASVTEILRRLGVETSKQDQGASNRVARCLKAAKWERFKSGPRGARLWRYRKSKAAIG